MKKNFEDNKKWSSEYVFYSMIAAIGVLILVISVITGRSLCLGQARETFNLTVRHLKNQCEEYNNFLDSDEVKSLFRITEQADDIGYTLENLEGDAKDAWLKEYIVRQRLSCIILTDENFNEIARYTSAGMDNVDFWSMIPSDAVAPIEKYPIKIYSDRIESNGGIYDMAAAARRDGNGVVLCFRLQNEENIKNYYSSVQKLIARDKNELNGNVVITEEDAIISSNSNNAEEKAKDIRVMSLLDDKAKIGNVVKISDDGNTYYGGKCAYKQYNIYVYYPEGEVFADCLNIVALVFCLYCIIVIFMIVFHQRSKYVHAVEINEQYEIIRTISGMFLFNIFVDIKRNRFRFLLRAADFAQVDEREPADKVLSTYFVDYVDEQYRDNYREFTNLATLKERLGGRDYIEIEYKNIHGEWLNDIIIPKRKNSNGEFDSFLLLTKNVNEQKMMEMEYQNRLKEAVQNEMKANKAKTDLLHRMSHDIRTPINAILGMVEMAERNVGDLEKQKYCRDQARIAAEYLIELVNDILTFNRIESGDKTETKNVFNLKDETEKIFTMVSVRAQAAGVKFDRPKWDAENTLLFGNVLYFHQIVINILTNAVKYSNKGGEVSFSFTLEPDKASQEKVFVRFVCVDNGIGMSEEFQKKMFEPFSQENNEEINAYGGLGLGLAIVKKLVEKLNGTIYVQSEQGIGTRFTIILPFERAKGENMQIEDGDIYSIKGRKLLVAEDNSINMEIAEFFVQEAGAEIVKAFDGKEAVEKFALSEIGEFDAILMDITMPVLDGMEATKKIRAMRRPDAKAIPIIAMTANLFIQDIEKCIKVGMDAYLPKPINERQFIKTIADEIDKRNSGLKNLYDNVGCDYGDIKKRFANEDVILRFVKKFKDDKSFKELESALKVNDCNTAFRAAHTLKGVCANLGFDSLYETASKMTEFLKEKDMPSAKALFTELEKRYCKILRYIEKL